MTLITLMIPTIMAFLSILIMVSLTTYFMIKSFIKYFKEDYKYLRDIFSSIFLLIVLITIVILLIRRYKRLKNLGVFLKLSTNVMKENIILVYGHMIILSLFAIFISWLFANLYYSVSKIG
jgi:hypothetical protein